MEYLHPPEGEQLTFPTNIIRQDARYLRRYIGWKYPNDFTAAELDEADAETLAKHLEGKGYSFKEVPYYDH